MVLILALLFGLGIVVLSVAPINRIAVGTRPGYAAGAAAVHHAAVVHVSVHIFIFAVTAGVAWFAACFGASGMSPKLAGMGLTFLLGWGTEFLQHAMTGRPIELGDVITNVSASGATFLVLALVWRLRRHFSSSRTLL
jgi:hypothetical protein